MASVGHTPFERHEPEAVGLARSVNTTPASLVVMSYYSRLKYYNFEWNSVELRNFELFKENTPSELPSASNALHTEDRNPKISHAKIELYAHSQLLDVKALWKACVRESFVVFTVLYTNLLAWGMHLEASDWLETKIQIHFRSTSASRDRNCIGRRLKFRFISDLQAHLVTETVVPLYFGLQASVGLQPPGPKCLLEHAKMRSNEQSLPLPARIHLRSLVTLDVAIAVPQLPLPSQQPRVPALQPNQLQAELLPQLVIQASGLRKAQQGGLIRW
ncbi:hypothetical protein B0H14DRAFT_2559096 [Mycena olivaceomarginata]|nr:hypothetical protein B0H14DRAFT_2559096 [Mycena olivaceomarginata]